MTIISNSNIKDLEINKIKVGIVSDGKFGERAFENIKKTFNTIWILVPEIEPNVIIDDEIDLKVPDSDLYISYVRHPDIILEIAKLNKPLILGVLPGQGLLNQAKRINPNIIHAQTMCSLENNTGIPIVDLFTSKFGRPIYNLSIDGENMINSIKVMRSSLCGSSEAGAQFLAQKTLSIENLHNFALSVCHECRAPRFGRSCDKEVAGIIHLTSIIQSLENDDVFKPNSELQSFFQNTKNEYEKRREK